MITKELLVEMVTRALELEPNQINYRTLLIDIEEYDSLGALSLFTALSEKTDEKSDGLDLTEATSIEEIFNILKKAELAV